jgi:PKD repeat protein
MNLQGIWYSLARAAAPLVLLVGAGNAFGYASYATTTDAYCTSFNNTKPIANNCTKCHAASKSTRVEPQWTWYLTTPVGASNQMQNFCESPNKAPDSTIATPSANATVTQGVAFSFAGSGSDPDNNTPLTYSWNFGGGAANSTAQNPTVTFATAGTYTVTFTVTDAKGLADPTPATRTITVVAPANQAPDSTITTPSANATVTQGVPFSFAGNGSDPDGNTPLTYSWNFGGGAANSTAQNPTVTFATAGTYTVTFTVTDAKGLADPTPATRTITVVAPTLNQAPDSTITTPSANATVTQGVPFSFAGNGSDPDGNTPLTYNWNFGGGAANSTAQNPTVTFATPGTYTVTFTVTDAKGLADPTPATRTITVVAPAPAGCRDDDGDGYSPDGGICGPVDCNDHNASINPGAREICGDGIDNDCDGKIDAADSECNGKDCVLGLLKPPVPVIITRSKWYPDTGKLEVYGNQAPVGTGVNLFNADTGALIDSGVTRGDGVWKFNLFGLNKVPCRIRVEIAGQSAVHHVNSAPANCDSGTTPGNQAPDSTITTPTANATVTQGVAFSFAGNGSDPDGNTPLTYSWNFGGGAANSTAQNPTVTFAAAGTYTVTFAVTDAKGLADPTPATRTITVVAPANRAPDGTITAPANSSTVERGKAVSFQGSGNDPDGNTPLAYAWDFGGAAASSAVQNPTVTFNTVGTVTVRLTVKDSKGLVDPTPALITIEVVEPAAALVIKKAKWDDEHLSVSGSGAPGGATVRLIDALNGRLIATVKASSSGSWKFDIKKPKSVPCSVRVEAGGGSAVRAVSDAPRKCSRSRDGDRERED